MTRQPRKPLFPDIDLLNAVAYVDEATLEALRARIDPERVQRVVEATQRAVDAHLRRERLRSLRACTTVSRLNR